MIPILLSALPLTAILTWLASLMVDPGSYKPSSVLILGIGWLIVGTVATVGMVLAGGRWTQRALVALMGTTLLVGLARPVDAWSIVGFALSAAGLAALFSPQLERGMRKLVSADGPPTKAVILVLLTLSYPLALGLIPVPTNGWVTIVALLGPAIAYAYSRVIRGGLASIRFVLPTVGLALAYPMGLPHGAAVVALSVAVATLAWSKEVALAFRPPVEKGTSYPIPPELAPTEILDGARIDESGRRI